MDNDMFYTHERSNWYLSPDGTAVIKGNLSLPLTTEPLEEIKKQNEAEKMAKAFSMLNTSDANIINYITLMLEDYINYLDITNLKTFINSMKLIAQENNLEPKDINFINQIIINLETRISLEKSNTSKQDNLDEFYELLDQFQELNKRYLNDFSKNITTTKAH